MHSAKPASTVRDRVVYGAPTGVRVNAVLPGNIRTKMTAGGPGADDAENERLGAWTVPQGRMGTPEEIADAVIWLSSSKSSFVIGHSLLVDGGWTAQ